MTIDLPKLIRASGGEIVGKVRLQKAVYLLDQLGLNSGFSYDYHHYGPYSAELAENLDFDVILGEVEEKTRRRVSDGVPYSVFRVPEEDDNEDFDRVGDLPRPIAENALQIMDRYSATVLELAATAYWIAHEEEVDDWRLELIQRKGIKTQSGRTDEAVELLSELDLALD